jgi:hypothetical protein
VPLQVAVKMYKLPVAVRIRSTHAPWVLVMAVELLTVKEEIPATDRAAPILRLGQFHVTGGQRTQVDLAP